MIGALAASSSTSVHDLDPGARQSPAARGIDVVADARASRRPRGCCANAPPMMPSPTTPTVPFVHCHSHRPTVNRGGRYTGLSRRVKANVAMARLSWRRIGCGSSVLDRVSSGTEREASRCTSELPGVGKMGAAIAQRLMEVGHTVTVWNRSADKTRPLADAGATVAATPAELASRRRGRHHHPHRRRRDRRGLQRAVRAAHRRRARGKLFIEMSTVQPATEVALADKVRAQGRRLGRVPGRRHHRPGAAGQADRAHGRRARRCRRAPSRILEQLCRRLEHCGPVGARRGHEAHHQPAADDLLAGARRGARALPAARARPGAHHGPAVATPRAAPTCSRCAAPRSPRCSKAATSGPVTFDVDSAASRTCARCWRKARRAASNCRSSSRRSPATRRRSARFRARPRSRPSRSIGRIAAQ